MITLIASIGEKNELGRDGDLCWHIRDDLKHFRELTTGHPVIMGRKTWESLPKKPLPGRLNIVVSGSGKGLNPDGSPEREIWARSLEEAVEEGKRNSEPDSPIYIIGGASIYREAMPLADRLEITRILATDPGADTFFPTIRQHEWRLDSATDIMTAPDGLEYIYETYERKPGDRD